ncbi:MAG: hypothetical protein E1N59_3215 [Puniceicoccaceae bacterium 5H]|nr:MAG: hypothetical protein E1N59_3215 [Puniceicoccaceae bacterium 5H]
MPKIPPPPSLDSVGLYFAKIAAETFRFPHPDVVNRRSGPVFPSVRARARRGKRLEEVDGVMLDDNTTPRWALLWSHGYSATGHPSGWVVAHVWEDADNVSSYTNLANLVLVPEPLSSLTDKRGPLVPFLRYHADQVYNWRPTDSDAPECPSGYRKLRWRYLPDGGDLVEERLGSLCNERVKRLRKQRIMRA